MHGAAARGGGRAVRGTDNPVYACPGLDCLDAPTRLASLDLPPPNPCSARSAPARGWRRRRRSLAHALAARATAVLEYLRPLRRGTAHLGVHGRGPRPLAPPLHERAAPAARHRAVSPRAAALIGWCGMRGIVTLAAALALTSGSERQRRVSRVGARASAVHHELGNSTRTWLVLVPRPRGHDAVR